MTNGDNSGDGGNRTVFRPSPLAGLGGAQQRPTPPPDPSAGQPAPQPAEQDSAAPPPQAAPAPRRRLSDDSVPTPKVERELRAPLVSEAGPLLALAASVRSGRARIGMDDFQREAASSLAEYEKAIAPRYPEETRRAAYYMLAATVDDIARNLPSLDGSSPWPGGLLRDVSAGGWSEDELWQTLDKALEHPEDNADLIELAHACIAAGFQGRYRGQPGGGEELEKWTERLYKGMDHVRGLSMRFVSPQWVGFNAPLQKVPAISIVVLALVAALALIVLAYVGLSVGTGRDIAAFDGEAAGEMAA